MKLHVNARCVQRMLALAALGTTLSLVGAPVLAAEPPHDDPLFDRKFLLYYLKASPVAGQKIADLKGLKIGATIGYFYGEALTACSTGGSPQSATTASTNWSSRTPLTRTKPD